MLSEICADIKNYFTHDDDKHFGKYSIEGGIIIPAVGTKPIDFLTDYIRIAGSHKNDGVHKLSDADLVDEGVFEGAVWVMSPPKAFLDLAKDIAAWQAKNGDIDSQAMSPFNSESFGGYSYSKSGGKSGSSSGGADWRNAFASRLNIYRKIRL